jgi:hypothetical protein
MKKIIVFLALFNFFTFINPAFSISDEKIIKKIIRQSVENYSGRCACPYNIMKNGKKCGIRSAYSKPGGYSPACYPSDVTQEMINKYRSK